MSKPNNVNLGFAVEIVHSDVFDFQADVLAIKDSPSSGGLDAQIRLRLKKAGILDNTASFLEEGDYRLWPGAKVARAQQILMVGAPSILKLHYAQLRDLGRNFLEALWDSGTAVEHLAMTAHGVQTALGLDEVEAFRSLLLGMADAYQTGHYPSTLKRVTFVEFNSKRAWLFQEALKEFLIISAPPMTPPVDSGANTLIDAGSVAAAETDVLRSAPSGKEDLAYAGTDNDETLAGWQYQTEVVTPKTEAEPVVRIAGPESFEPEFRKPEANASTPHVFVAMPFKDTYDDQFYLAIQPCVKDAGLLCERMDLDVFTGEITDRMFERIQSAQLVIALLDGGNPNVYLEIGYAWGVKAKTVLLAQKEEPLPFDVRGHRVLIYDKIYQLKDMLKVELERLLKHE